MAFAKLDDSPMFREQIQLLEQGAETLRERTLKFYKGCRKYTEVLGEAYDGDIAFASSLEMFGGHGDPVDMAFGGSLSLGSVFTQFTIALREIGTYKEVLRSQLENILNDKLIQFVNFDLYDVKEARKRFDKASLLCDQARERYLSLRKSTKADVTAAMEEELYNARTSFEQARFTLVTALSNIEAKKKFEFLEAIGRSMDAHLYYFKQGYELLHQMEPYIRQVLTNAQELKERSECEEADLSERMNEFKRKIDRETRFCFHSSPSRDGIQVVGRNSNKQIEAAVRTAARGKIQIIQQGYLSKRSSNLRGDWKRRFFVLDSKGMLYYYRKRSGRSSGSSSSNTKGQNPSELSSGLLSRWFSSHYHGGVHDEKSIARHTVNLLTSTLKVDADQSDLRFCFRIISPTKSYTLQAESAADQMDWIEKITSVIASLLSSQPPEQNPSSFTIHRGHRRSASECNSLGSPVDHDLSGDEGYPSEQSVTAADRGQVAHSLEQHLNARKNNNHIEILRKVSGNHVCADCGAPEPDWASLNLGILLCIECSGVHRNLGVHLSKVRSLTLDVKVWEPSIINLFKSLGNTFANSIWEELLPEASNKKFRNSSSSFPVPDEKEHITIKKPRPTDSISVKEKFIHAKYAEKLFVRKLNVDPHVPVAKQMWDSVYMNDKKSVYHHIVSYTADVNAAYDSTTLDPPFTEALPQQEQITDFIDQNDSAVGDILIETPTMDLPDQDNNDPTNCPEGLSLLHVACLTADIGMVELLLQYGANLNATDMKGQTPLHHCAIKGKNDLLKLLVRRGADPGTFDKQGKTPLHYALEPNSIIDEEVLFMLEDRGRTLS